MTLQACGLPEHATQGEGRTVLWLGEHKANPSSQKFNPEAGGDASDKNGKNLKTEKENQNHTFVRSLLMWVDAFCPGAPGAGAGCRAAGLQGNSADGSVRLRIPSRARTRPPAWRV